MKGGVGRRGLPRRGQRPLLLGAVAARPDLSERAHDAHTVEVFLHDQRIASHAQCPFKGRHTTVAGWNARTLPLRIHAQHRLLEKRADHPDERPRPAAARRTAHARPARTQKLRGVAYQQSSQIH